MMKNIFDETLESLAATLEHEGFKPFAAKQIFDWIYKKRVHDFARMSNLAKPLRQHLLDHYMVGRLETVRRVVSEDGTKKYLFGLKDHHLIEAVLMAHPYGKSLCVTTQVGCNIGCAFCASGLEKKTRDLTVGEMVMQVLEVESLEAERVSHVVIMGTGEPFDNYDNVMAFIDIINAPHGLEIGARHITVSTSGIVPNIDAFATRPLQVNLAISLHAPNDAIRSRLMKINHVYPMDALLESVKRYVDATNRRVTFEYILLDHVNDDIAHADELSNRIRGINAYVNVIRYNPVGEFDFKPSEETRARAFFDRLMKRGIVATYRRERGGDINAACGQLRIREQKGR